MVDLQVEPCTHEPCLSCEVGDGNDVIGAVVAITDGNLDDLILLGPLRLAFALVANLGDLHTVIWRWFHFLHNDGRAAALVCMSRVGLTYSTSHP
jgi:hypothetical protein